MGRRVGSGRAVAGLGIVGLAVLAGGGLVAQAQVVDRLDAAVTERAEELLPGGSVLGVEVGDTPALLAGLRGHVQQAMVDGRTADGRPATLIVRELDVDGRRSESVSWYLEGLDLAPGWTNVRSETGVFLNAAERDVDGRRVVVSGVATLAGSTLSVTPGEITVDGAPTAWQDVPAAVRGSLTPLTTPVPLPVAGLVVESVWFDEGGLSVALRARDVVTGSAAG